MKTNILNFNKTSGILLVSVVIVLAVLALIHAMQEPSLLLRLSSVSWNGTVSY